MITLTGNTQTTYDKILNKYFAYLNDSNRVNQDVAEIKTEVNEFLELHKDADGCYNGFIGWNLITEHYQFVNYFDDQVWTCENLRLHIQPSKTPLMFIYSLASLEEMQKNNKTPKEVIKLIINQLNDIHNIISLNNQLDNDHIRALSSATAYITQLVVNGNQQVINDLGQRMLCLSLLNWVPNHYLKNIKFDDRYDHILKFDNFRQNDGIEKYLETIIPNGQAKNAPFSYIWDYKDITNSHFTCQVIMQQLDAPLDDNIKNINFRDINTDMILQENNDKSQFFNGMYSGLSEDELDNNFARFSTLKMCFNEENYRKIRTNPQMTVKDVFDLLKNQWNL